MTALVFVDTNVLVYARDTTQEAKQERARDWLATLWRTRNGRLSAQVLSEYYYVVTRKLPRKLPEPAAWSDVVLYSQWSPRAVDVALLDAARDVVGNHRVSWWDALILAAARSQGCALLLSEDLQDGAVFGGVTVCNPFRTSLSEAVAAYAVDAAPAPLHRGRGRPRRAAAG
jgi:predicted nucleic acid-binding protein